MQGRGFETLREQVFSHPSLTIIWKHLMKQYVKIFDFESGIQKITPGSGGIRTQVIEMTGA